MALLNFKYGLQSSLASTPYSQGTVYIAHDTKRMYVDLPEVNGTHLCIGDFQLVSYDTSSTPLAALDALTIKENNVLYITVGPTSADNATEITGLYRYTGTEFKAISNTNDINTLNSKILNLEASITTLTTATTTAQERADNAYVLAEQKTTMSEVNAVLTNYMPLAGGTFSGAVSMGANASLTVNTPTANGHATSKAYVDSETEKLNTALALLQDKIGNLSNIMNFAGMTTTALTDGATTNPIVINNTDYTASAGDVVIVGGSAVGDSTIGDFILGVGKEFVFDGTNWYEIGDTNAQSTAIVGLQGKVADLEEGLQITNDVINTHTEEIAELEQQVDSHATEYTNLKTQVDELDQEVEVLSETVGTKPTSPTMDTTLWEEVADLRNDLGESNATAGTTTVFARIKSMEAAIGTSTDSASATGSLYGRVAKNTADITTANTAIANNTQNITDIITILTWGTF